MASQRRRGMIGGGIVLFVMLFAAAAVAQEKDARVRRLEFEVRRELLMLTNYGIFDHLAFQVQPGGTIRLLGQVTRPTLKSDAEARVKDVQGVEQVINDIEVLPVSQGDDRIRVAIARNIYRTESLERYGFQAQPSIHIIVKNGRVTLEGAVDNEADKTIAGMKAREVGGVFEVTNNLVIAR
jgi:hyperosmotically inducible protein